MPRYHVGVVLTVAGALSASYLGWAYQRMHIGDNPYERDWPRPWPYPDGWLHTWERSVDANRAGSPDLTGRVEGAGHGHPDGLVKLSGDVGQPGKAETVQAWLCPAALIAAGIGLVGLCLWLPACRRAPDRVVLTGADADYSEGPEHGPDGTLVRRLSEPERAAFALSQPGRPFVRAGLPTAAVMGALLALLSAWPARSGRPGPPIPLRSVVLHDLSMTAGPNHFGCARTMWATSDGEVIVRYVRLPMTGEGTPTGHRGLWENRYRFTLAAGQWAELERLVGTHDVTRLRSRVRGRWGAVSDRLTVIAVGTQSGDSAVAAKWDPDPAANTNADPCPDFDAIKKYLHDICKTVLGLKPLYEGAFDPNWRPDGY